MPQFTNMAGWDRVLRIALGTIMLYLGWSGLVEGTLGAIFKVVGVIPVVTGVIGWCAVYELFGFSTRSHPPTPPTPSADAGAGR
jgi:hypothetical protein